MNCEKIIYKVIDIFKAIHEIHEESEGVPS